MDNGKNYKIIDLYGKKKIKEAVKYLSKNQRIIAELYYNLDDQRELSINEIELLLNLKQLDSRINGINKLIVNIINNPEIKLEHKARTRGGNINIKLYIEKIVSNGLSKLSSKEQYLALKIKEVNSRKLTLISRVAQELGVDKQEIYNLFISIKEKINEIFEYSSDKDDEKIKNYIKALNKDDRDFIFLYYGLRKLGVYPMDILKELTHDEKIDVREHLLEIVENLNDMLIKDSYKKSL